MVLLNDNVGSAAGDELVVEEDIESDRSRDVSWSAVVVLVAVVVVVEDECWGDGEGKVLVVSISALFSLVSLLLPDACMEIISVRMGNQTRIGYNHKKKNLVFIYLFFRDTGGTSFCDVIDEGVDEEDAEHGWYYQEIHPLVFLYHHHHY